MRTFRDVIDEKARRFSSAPFLLAPEAQATLTYADLSAYQLVAGLAYAFPKAMARLGKRHPNLMRLHARVAVRPRIAAYLASERRIANNEDDIFRLYPELDE